MLAKLRHIGATALIACCVVASSAACEPDLNADDRADVGAAEISSDLCDTVGIIGDSLTADMQSQGDFAEYSKQMDSGKLRIDAAFGRRINSPAGDGADSSRSTTNQVVKDWRSGGFDPCTWVVALGTNDAAVSEQEWEVSIRSVVDEIVMGSTGQPTICWITTGYERRDAFKANEFAGFLQKVAPAVPSLRVMDYTTFLDRYRESPLWPIWWEGSGIHNSAIGYHEVRLPYYEFVLSSCAGNGYDMHG